MALRIPLAGLIAGLWIFLVNVTTVSSTVGWIMGLAVCLLCLWVIVEAVER